jgi:hypothetical protein
LALLSDGTVVAWGANEHGQLGDGSTEASEVPVPVSGLDDRQRDRREPHKAWRCRRTVTSGRGAATTRVSSGMKAKNRAICPAITSLSPKAGPAAAGTEVTIKGENFEEVSELAFAGTPASDVQTLSSHELQVVSPEHAVGNVDVAVTASGGSSTATSKSKFKYKKK